MKVKTKNSFSFSTAYSCGGPADKWPQKASGAQRGRVPLVLAVLLLLSKGSAFGELVGPYTVDEHTLHLWHMDESAVPAADAVTNGVPLASMDNGATLGNESYNDSKKFGTALATYTGNPLMAPGSAGQGAFLSALPIENGPGDNVALDYAGDTGAFTYEAIVRIDFDPTVNCGADGWGQGKNPFMQIICADADETPSRVFQFRLVPIGTLNGNAEPQLEFINLNKGTDIQSISAPIPMDGPDAIRAGNWYHVAVSYTGQPDTDDNIHFYWTLLSPERASADMIGSGRMKHSLPDGCSPDFAIGQTGRQSPMTTTPNNNFVGLIDEVRMSGVARSATEMQFAGQVVVAKSAPTANSPVETAVATKTPPQEPKNDSHITSSSPSSEPLASPKPQTPTAVAVPEKARVTLAETAVPGNAVAPASQPTTINGAVSRGPLNRRQIAIAFSCRDAGADGPAILNTLKARHARASFFLTPGFLLWSSNKELVRSMLDQGCFVGPESDGWTPYAKSLSSSGSSQNPMSFSDVQFHLNQLAALGVDLKSSPFFLPTADQLNNAVSSRARDLGLTMISGTPGTLSFADDTFESSTNFVSSQAIVESILQRERRDATGLNGFILLFHLDPTPWRKDKFFTHFDELIDALHGRGYEFVRVDELLNGGSPQVSSTTEITRPLSQ